MDTISILIRLFSVLFLSFVLNIPLGMWRTKTKKFSLPWFISIHLAVPLVYFFRVKNGLASWSIGVLIIFAILGQLIGGLLIGKYSKLRNVSYKNIKTLQ